MPFPQDRPDQNPVLAAMRVPQARELRSCLDANAVGVLLLDDEQRPVGVCVPVAVYQLLYQLASTVSDVDATVRLFDLTGAEGKIQGDDAGIGDVFPR